MMIITAIAIIRIDNTNINIETNFNKDKATTRTGRCEMNM